MWEFVHRARTHPYLESLDALEAAGIVERCLAEWADGVENAWRSWFPRSDDPKAEFVYTWDRIKWPRAVLEQAVAEAATLPLKPVRSYSPKYEEFISIVGHLQRLVEGSVVVPCSKFADLLGCQPMTITRYREFATASGLLKLTRRGIKAQRKADEFMFAVERFDWESGNQIPSENLNLCLTSPAKCYTEIQDMERKKETQEIQEKQEKKEIQEKQRETRAHLPAERKCAMRREPYIPTAAELEQELQETVHLRKLRPFACK